ncbi:MAG: hypothetical protein NT128_00145 [Proteobacteria bacterium]|nr:hypothetical protein [Pseudomonadota bacterium]
MSVIKIATAILRLPTRLYQNIQSGILENFEDDYAIKRFPNCLESRDNYLNSAQTAQTIVMALPRELEVEVAIEIAWILRVSIYYS